MIEPIKKTLRFKKKGQPGFLNLDFLMCTCDHSMEEIGIAGCSHDSDYTHFYQCAQCKNLILLDYKFSANSLEEIKKAGWELIDTK